LYNYKTFLLTTTIILLDLSWHLFLSDKLFQFGSFLFNECLLLEVFEVSWNVNNLAECCLRRVAVLWGWEHNAVLKVQSHKYEKISYSLFNLIL